MMTSAEERTRAWQIQSLLLSYPDQHLLNRRPLLHAAVATLPKRIAGPLERFLDSLDRTPLPKLAADYVATFDHHKRFSLFLTYFTYGDTRKRGMALLRFKHAYTAVGLDLAGDELPDHLAVVLEFASCAPEAGRRLLVEHRAGLELLRLGLHEARSPWADVIDSVTATLPALTRRDRTAVARLAATGPEQEQVGLDPYGRAIARGSA
jgi:nitrate reductase delta subunit